jgi:hypothetical protein
LTPGAVDSAGRLVSLAVYRKVIHKNKIILLHNSSSREFQQRFIITYFKHIGQK